MTMMMKPTLMKLSPVITLLSTNPAASKRAQDILGSLFGMVKCRCNNNNDNNNDDYDAARDALDATLDSSFLPRTTNNSMKWNSVASKCPNSGAILHWLAISSSSSSDASEQQQQQQKALNGTFELLSITSTISTTSDNNKNETTGQDNNSSNSNKSIQRARQVLAEHFPTSLFSFQLRYWAGRPMTADSLLKNNQGLPVLDVDEHYNVSGNNNTTYIATQNNTNNDDGGGNNNNIRSSDNSSGRLKEVAFTFYDDAIYPDGTDLMTKLSLLPNLSRPVTGVYEWPNNNSNGNNNNNQQQNASSTGVCLRPLPTAHRDFQASSRSIVLSFHCDSVEEQQQQLENNSDDTKENIHWSKIGFTGLHQKRGQLRLHAVSNNNNNNIIDYLPGLDIRWCEALQPSSMFNEAQEALLASSLMELQSPNVLLKQKKEGGTATITSTPGKQDNSDCWVEVRTMMQNPRGFWGNSGRRGRSSSSSGGPRVATAPPSYPE